jgi:hypothetical protein
MIFAVYFDWVELHVAIGPYYIHHWLSWIGASFVAIFTPIYYWMKRKYPTKIVNLLRVHVVGNLISVLFVSIHFTQQISRPAQFYPDLATGVVLYPTILLLAATGFIARFTKIKHKNSLRFFHRAITLTFYFTILIHVLHGIGII